VDPPLRFRGVGECLTGTAFVLIVAMAIVWALVLSGQWR
jgi:hypothetical protein